MQPVTRSQGSSELTINHVLFLVFNYRIKYHKSLGVETVDVALRPSMISV